MQADLEYLAAVVGLHDHRFFGVLGEHGNAVDLGLYLVQFLGHVFAEFQHQSDGALIFGGGGGDLVHAVNAGYLVLNRADNALLDFSRAGTGIGHGDVDLVQGEFGKGLLRQA